MQTAKKRTIVVVDASHRDLKDILGAAGFDVLSAGTEEGVLQAAREHGPSLIIGDFKTGGISVPHFCRKIKKDFRLGLTPIIIVTERGEIREKIEAVNGGADDYIVSPFHEEELIARIRRVISATENALNANPLTRLPGNIALKHEIHARISVPEDFAACYFDLDNFKVFNDTYGYERGDMAITFTARTILDVMQMREFSHLGNFIGHIGGDDFVALTPPLNVDALCSRIIRQFDSGIRSLYDPKDRKRGYIIGRDRRGETHVYPLMTISIAVTVSHDRRRFRHVAEVSQTGAEIKRYLKQFKKSNYMVDRRN
jgi:diguanylate cyclase (GGDEF)-like protein